jgi:hypothetical protein
MIWEKISFALVAVLLALQLGYAVSIFLGFGLTLLYSIGGEFLETALQVPDMLLYSHYVTAGVCLVLAAWNAWELIAAIKNKERLTGALQKAALLNAIAVWTFPIVNILTDVVVTSMKRDGANLRSHTAYDVFDMGLNLLVPAIIAVVCFVIMYVNNRLAPEDNLADDE